MPIRKKKAAKKKGKWKRSPQTATLTNVTIEKIYITATCNICGKELFARAEGIHTDETGHSSTNLEVGTCRKCEREYEDEVYKDAWSDFCEKYGKDYIAWLMIAKGVKKPKGV